MSSYLFKINDISKYDNVLQKLLASNHAIILHSQDRILLDSISKLLVMKIECKNEKAPCFYCDSCKKILDDNALDVEMFGYEKNIVVEDSKKIIEDSYVLPLEFQNKYFILNNFESATMQAQNKLLKIIEEPQEYDKYIILVQNLDAVLSTIKSRCEIYSLPKFSNEELKNIFDYNIGEGKKVNFAVQYANGNLTRLNDVFNDEQFGEIYSQCQKLVLNMTNSGMVLEYTNEIAKYKDKIDMVLEILASFYRDMLSIKYQKQNLVQNMEIINQLVVLSNMTSEIALVMILKEIEKVRQKLKFNSNFNGVIDNLLLKILEIKHLCK